MPEQWYDFNWAYDQLKKYESPTAVPREHFLEAIEACRRSDVEIDKLEAKIRDKHPSVNRPSRTWWERTVLLPEGTFPWMRDYLLQYAWDSVRDRLSR